MAMIVFLLGVLVGVGAMFYMRPSHKEIAQVIDIIAEDPERYKGLNLKELRTVGLLK